MPVHVGHTYLLAAKFATQGDPTYVCDCMECG